jgi:hypothetical protein
MGKLQEHRTVARRSVEVRTEVAQLEADLARVRARRERLLDSMMEGDIQRAVFRDKLAELDTQERNLQEHLTRARAKVTQEEAQRAREDGALRFCRFAQRGLARLDDKGRQKLLGTLVEKAVMAGDRIELHTVLPTHVEGPPPSRKQDVHYRSEEEDVVAAGGGHLRGARGLRLAALTSASHRRRAGRR